MLSSIGKVRRGTGWLHTLCLQLTPHGENRNECRSLVDVDWVARSFGHRIPCKCNLVEYLNQENGKSITSEIKEVSRFEMQQVFLQYRCISISNCLTLTSTIRTKTIKLLSLKQQAFTHIEFKCRLPSMCTSNSKQKDDGYAFMPRRMLVQMTFIYQQHAL